MLTVVTESASRLDLSHVLIMSLSSQTVADCVGDPAGPKSFPPIL